jgi:hypothetical protein
MPRSTKKPVTKLSSKPVAKLKSKSDGHKAQRIVIDEKGGLVFSSEDELYDHFLPQIQALEKDYFESRAKDDILETEFPKYEHILSELLDQPDEIWQDEETLDGFRVMAFLGHYTFEGAPIYYVALAYMTGETPSFVFLHFPTRDLDLVDHFRRGQMIYDRIIKEVENGAMDGDALSEGDDLAVGLYKAMLKVRAERDIPEEEFHEYEAQREPTIEEADEIWRTNDLSGNILVSFIKDFSDQDEHELTYIVVTIEDPTSSSHALLFSFPTKDRNLVDRYRHGENLQAEEVVQEASH